MNERTQEMAREFKLNIAPYMEAQGKTRMDIVRDLRVSYPTAASWENETFKRLNSEYIDALMEYLKIPNEEFHKFLEFVDVPEENAG